MSQLRIQTARAVAYRALCLGALLQRAELEVSMKKLDEWSVFDGVREAMLKKHRDHHQHLQQWLDDEGISSHLSEGEAYLLNKALGTWSERSLFSVSWRTEALGILLWALNRLEFLPTYDNRFSLIEVLDPLEILSPSIDFIWMANLRDESILFSALEQAELWNWRSRARELERMGVRPPEGFSFRQIIHHTTERAFQNGHIPDPIEGDFPALGKAYFDLDVEEFTTVSAIAYERVSALNWICEVTSEWESIRVDKKQ